MDRTGLVNNVEMKSIIHERKNSTDKSFITMVEDQAPEYRNNLTASGCMLNLKEDNNTFVLKTNMDNAKSYADIEIVYEKLMANEIEGNGRISWKINSDQLVIENKKTKSVYKDFFTCKM